MNTVKLELKMDRKKQFVYELRFSFRVSSESEMKKVTVFCREIS